MSLGVGGTTKTISPNRRFCELLFEASCGRHPYAHGLRHLAGGGSAELRSWKAFGQWVNIIRKASPKTTIPEHALYAARKIVAFIQGITSSEERSSVVEESSSLVLSLLSREDDCGTSQLLSERARKLSEVALQKGLESSRQALHKWLSQALKGGAGPTH